MPVAARQRTDELQALRYAARERTGELRGVARAAASELTNCEAPC
jgi:hypothetical protein